MGILVLTKAEDGFALGVGRSALFRCCGSSGTIHIMVVRSIAFLSYYSYLCSNVASEVADVNRSYLLTSC